MRCNTCKLAGKCREIREAGREHFKWSFHNLIGHPLSEVAYLVGLKRLSHWIHNQTIPKLV